MVKIPHASVFLLAGAIVLMGGCATEDATIPEPAADVVVEGPTETPEETDATDSSLSAQSVADAFGCVSLPPGVSIATGVTEYECESAERDQRIVIIEGDTRFDLFDWLKPGSLKLGLDYLTYNSDEIIAYIPEAAEERITALDILFNQSRQTSVVLDGYWYPGFPTSDDEYTANVSVIFLDDVPPVGSPSDLGIYGAEETINMDISWDPSYDTDGGFWAVWMRTPNPGLKEKEGQNLVGTFFWDGRIIVVDLPYKDFGVWY